MQASDVKVGEWFRASGTDQRLCRVEAIGFNVSYTDHEPWKRVLAVDESHRLHAVHGDNSAILDVTAARRRAIDVIGKMQDADLTDLLLAAGIVPHVSIEGRAEQMLIKLTGSAT